MKKLIISLLLLAISAEFCFGQSYKEPEQIDSILSKILLDFRAKRGYILTNVDTCSNDYKNCNCEVQLPNNQTLIKCKCILDEVSILFTFDSKEKITGVETHVLYRNNNQEKYFYSKNKNERFIKRVQIKENLEETSEGRNCIYMFFFYELRGLAKKLD